MNGAEFVTGILLIGILVYFVLIERMRDERDTVQDEADRGQGSGTEPESKG